MVLELPIPPPDGWTLADAARHICLGEFAEWTFRRKKTDEARTRSNWTTPTWPRFNQPIDQSEWVEQEKRRAEQEEAAALRSLATAFRREMVGGEWRAEGRHGTTANPRQPIGRDQWDALDLIDFDRNEVAESRETGTRYYAVRIGLAPAATARISRQIQGVLSGQGATEEPKKKVAPRGRPGGNSDAARYAQWIVSWWPSGMKPPGMSDEDLRRKIQAETGLPVGGKRPSPSTINNAKREALRLAQGTESDGFTPSSDDPPA